MLPLKSVGGILPCFFLASDGRADGRALGISWLAAASLQFLPLALHGILLMSLSSRGVGPTLITSF